MDTPGPLPAGQPRAALVDAVTAALTPLRGGTAAVVACSGGADSTALAFLVAEARPDLELTIAHVRHGLRDDSADAEVARQHASWLGVDHVEADVEVVRAGHGTEAAARRARYEALRRIAAQVGTGAGGSPDTGPAEVRTVDDPGSDAGVPILVGHTADDQAETVLLRLARGTGTDGLAAMQVVSGDLVRPMLRLRRGDLRRFVALEGLPYVDDPTNRDPAVRRALVRHELLPRLAEVGPDPVGALARLADLARADADALGVAAAPLREQARWVGDAASLPSATLRAAPTALAARVVREILAALVGQAPSAETVVRVLAAGGSRATSLPGGVELTRSRGWLTLSRRDLVSASAQAVPEDGEMVWGPAGRSLRVVHPATDAGERADGQLPFDLVGAWEPPKAKVAPGALPPGGVVERMTLALPTGVERLELRHRRPGDRLTTSAGTKRVVDVAAEAGLPPPMRARWPVVAAGEWVVWFPGFAVDRTVAEQGRGAPAKLLVLDLPADRSRPRGG